MNHIEKTSWIQVVLNGLLGAFTLAAVVASFMLYSSQKSQHEVLNRPNFHIDPPNGYPNKGSIRFWNLGQLSAKDVTSSWALVRFAESGNVSICKPKSPEKIKLVEPDDYHLSLYKSLFVDKNETIFFVGVVQYAGPGISGQRSEDVHYLWLNPGWDEPRPLDLDQLLTLQKIKTRLKNQMRNVRIDRLNRDYNLGGGSVMSVSDGIQILLVVVQLFSVIVLGLLALYQESIKRRWFNPDLYLSFHFGPPDCHKTEFRDPKTLEKYSDAYYFRFSVKNTGKSHAQLCEAVLETVCIWKDDSAKWEPISRWNPINLKWSGNSSGNEYRTINPARKVYCDIGHIDSRKPDVFWLEAQQAWFNQDNFFRKGRYRLGISVYCENSRKNRVAQIEIDVQWTGEWIADESEMFKKAIILHAYEFRKHLT